MDHHVARLFTYMASQWSQIVTNYSPEYIEILGTFAVHFGFSWIVSLVFTLVDLSASQSMLEKYKIQPISKQATRHALLQCIPSAFQNQILTTVLHSIKLLVLRRVTGRFFGYRIEHKLPSLAEILMDIPLCFIARDFLYYYGHRVLHQPWFYRRFHKQHHKFTAPVAISTEHMHPVEHILVNILPIFIPSTLLRVHVVTFWLILTSAIAQGALGHSGWHLRSVFGRKTTTHDAHHEMFNVNYGTLGLMDWVHGTAYVAKASRKGEGKTQ